VWTRFVSTRIVMQLVRNFFMAVVLAVQRGAGKYLPKELLEIFCRDKTIIGPVTALRN